MGLSFSLKMIDQVEDLYFILTNKVDPASIGIKCKIKLRDLTIYPS